MRSLTTRMSTGGTGGDVGKDRGCGGGVDGIGGGEGGEGRRGCVVSGSGLGEQGQGEWQQDGIRHGRGVRLLQGGMTKEYRVRWRRE